MWTTRCALWCIVLALLLTTSATASSYDAGANNGPTGCSVPVFTSDPDSVAATVSLVKLGPGSGGGSASTAGSYEGLHGHVGGSLFGNGAGATWLGGCTFARQTLDDVVITGPAGTVPVSFSVHVVGSYSETISGFTDSFPSAVVKTNIDGGGNGIIDFPATADTVVTSSPVTVNVGVPFSIATELYVTTRVLAGSAAGSSISFDTDYAAAFPTEIPVFTLPAGYTANSADGRIVDNFYNPDAITAVYGRDIPSRTALQDAVPNPFNPSTRLSFNVAAAGHARLVIYDISGRLVRTLIDGHRGIGSHEVVWDGRDAAGRMSAAGVYLYRLEADGVAESKRMMLVK